MGVGVKNIYELLNLRALKFPPVDAIYIFQGMGKIFCVQRVSLKFHTKFLTHTLKDIIFIQSSYAFLKRPLVILRLKPLTWDLERSPLVTSSLVMGNLEICLRYSQAFPRYWPINQIKNLD